MRILLIMHDCRSPYNVLPYGIAYIGAVLGQLGHTVTLFDMASGHYTDNELAVFLENEEAFDFIGVGFQAAYYHTVEPVCSAVKQICPDTPLVLGGNAPSASPEHCLNAFNADYILAGETEHTLGDFVRFLAGECSPEDVPGLYWREEGVIRHTQKAPVPGDLDKIPFPAWELFDMQSYTFPRRVPGVNGIVRALGMLTTRGCPYACKFCYRMEPGFRVRSAENCIEELRILSERYRVDHIGFHDELFMVSKQRTIELCEAFIDSGIRFTWTCNGRYNIADREQLKIMREAGCIQISYGLESGDQAILDEMDKRITVEQILDVSAMTKQEGILVSAPSMFGLPHETEDSLEKTVDIVIRSTSWHDKRTIRPMQPYPGTHYFDHCIEKGLLKDAGDFFSRYFSSENWTVNLTDVPDDRFNIALLKANTRLLEEFHRQNCDAEIEMFRSVYFDQDADGFVPMR